MPFPDFDSEAIEHREIRRLTVAHALFIWGQLAKDLDLSAMMGLPPGLAGHLEDAFEILGDETILVALDIQDDVRPELQDP